MKKERVSESTVVFNSSIKSVWDVVTNNTEYNWRSDIKEIKVLNEGKSFFEYPHKGDPTKFIITNKKEYRSYKYNMQNRMFTGTCTGYFSETQTGGTILILKENIIIEHPIVSLLSYFFMDLKKIQKTYISDLKKRLGEY